MVFRPSLLVEMDILEFGLVIKNGYFLNKCPYPLWTFRKEHFLSNVIYEVMIYKENVILRAILFEYFNNSLYFKSYGRLFRKYPIFLLQDLVYHQIQMCPFLSKFEL